MPALAFGNYEIAATSGEPGQGQEFCRTEFFCFPLSRAGGVVVLVIAVGLLALRRRQKRPTAAAEWPIPLALALLTYEPLSLAALEPSWLFFLPAPLLGLAGVLWAAARFCRRRRVVFFFLIFVINAVVQLVVTYAQYRMLPMDYGFLMFYGPCLVGALGLSVPVLAGLLCAIPRFGLLRLALCMGIACAVTAACGLEVNYLVYSMPIEPRYLFTILLFVLPQPLAFFLFMAFSPASRETVMRVFGLKG